MTEVGDTDRIEFDAPERLLERDAVAWAVGRVRSAARTADMSRHRLSIGLYSAAAPGGRPEGFPEPPHTPESYRARTGRDGREVRVLISGSDERALSYALSEIAERITVGRSADAVGTAGEETHRPAVPVRSIQRAFSSVHEDTAWFHDREFWSEYLDFVAAQRFNRFHLALGMQYNYGAEISRTDAAENYFCFAYPFLLDIPGFSVRAQGVDRAERDRNLESLAHIARETRRREMDFQLGLWNHAYDYGSGVDHSHPILGIAPETHADYCAAALSELLLQVPDIDGITFRVHYEGGIPERGRTAFWDRMFQAVSDAGRPMRVDLHAKGLDAAMLAALRKPNIRPTASLKYWAEHMGLPYHQASIRQWERTGLSRAQLGDRRADLMGVTEMSRRFTRYGYADFLDEDRELDVIFRMWPGTQKLLLWGDPVLAAGFGRYATLGGALGMEFCEPLFFKGRKGSGRPGRRDPYVHPDLALGIGDWRKYRYTYLLWGRLLYDPDSPPETWRRFLRREYGDAAAEVEALLAPLSRILPLVTVAHAPSVSNNAYWPEVYADLPISPWVRSRHYGWDTASADWVGVSSLDPEMFYTVGEYTDDALTGRLRGKYTPLEVASWIERFTAEGESVLDRIRERPSSGGGQARRTLIDAEILVRLGRFFAGKFRAAVAYALYVRTGAHGHITDAVELLTAAHEAYAGIGDLTAGVYRDELAFGHVLSERTHWSKNLAAMADDLHALRLERVRAGEAAGHGEAGRPVVRETRPALDGVRLAAPERFRRGAPLEVGLIGHPDVLGRITGATLRFRHLDQSKEWSATEMRRDGDGFTASIPADITSTTFPVMCFAEVHLTDEAPALLPGFEPDLANQPYLVIHSSACPNTGGDGV